MTKYDHVWLHHGYTTKGAKLARGKGEGGLFKDARGFWTATVELPPALDGKRRRKVIRRKSKTRALSELKELKSTVATYGDTSTSSVSLKAWLTYWMAEVVPGTVRPNTYSNRANYVNAYLVPLLGHKRLDKLTARDVRDFHKRLGALPADKRMRARPEREWPDDFPILGASAISGAHATLNAALKSAVDEQKLTINAAEISGPPKPGAVAQQNALSVAQTADLLAYLATHPQGAMWTTYILTGARRGEVLGLEADRVQGDTLDMSWQMQSFSAQALEAARSDYEVRHVRGTLYLCRPKSSAGWRILPLVDPLKSVLELHMQGRGDGLLFVDANGEAEHPSAISRQWRELLAEAKIDADVKLHGVRHTVVDLLYDAGVPEQVIQQIVGHSTAKMTRSYKTRVNQGEAQRALESLGSFIAQV